MPRHLLSLIFVSAVLCTLFIHNRAGAQTANLLSNGDFSQGLVGWSSNQPSAGVNANGEFEASVSRTGTPWSWNLSYPLALDGEQSYTLRFRARASLARSLIAGWGMAQAPWVANLRSVQLGLQWQNYEIKGKTSFGSDPRARIIFDYGHLPGTVFIDEVSLLAEALDSRPRFTLIASAEGEGQIQPSGEVSVKRGGKQRFAITPGTGYQIADVLVDGVSVGAVASYTLSNVQRAHTIQARFALPPAPGALRAENISASGLNLLWDAPEKSAAVLAYEIYQDDTLVSTTNETRLTIGGLASGTRYRFHIVAWDSRLNRSLPSQPLEITTGINPDALPPRPPQNLYIVGTPSEDSVLLAWARPPLSARISSYRVFRDGVLVATPRLPEYIDKIDLYPQTRYQYHAIAVDADGRHSEPSAILEVTTGPDQRPPTAPTGLRTLEVSDNYVVLEWTPATDKGGVAGYRVYNHTGNAIATLPAVSTHTVSGLSPRVIYLLTLRAFDHSGNEGPGSNAVSFETRPYIDREAPSTPQNFYSPAQGLNSIQLAWDAASDNLGVSAYEIFQNGALLIRIPASTSYLATDLTEDTAYNFNIYAVDAAGNRSAASRDLGVRTQRRLQRLSWALDEDPIDGAWNYSQVSQSGGSQYRAARRDSSEADEAKTSFIDAFQGGSALHFHFIHNGSGLAEVSLPGSARQPGAEAETAADADTPKDLSAFEFLRFWIKGEPQTRALFSLQDAEGQRSRSVDLTTLIESGARWQQVDIPLAEFGNVDLRRITRLLVGVDKRFEAGDWVFQLDNVEFVTRGVEDEEAPQAPANLRVHNSHSTAVALIWEAASDDFGVAGYNIYRDNEWIGSSTRAAYLASGLEADRDYQFQVEAYDAAGNLSASSNLLSVLTERPDDLLSALPWAADDHADDGAWNTSHSESSGGSRLSNASASGEVATTRDYPFEGFSALALSIEHLSGGELRADIPSHPELPGYEPATLRQRDSGKDVSGYADLRFYLRGDAHGNLAIALRDSSGSSSQAVLLSDYITAPRYAWQEVRIPLSDFGNQVNLHQVVAVSFVVDARFAPGSWTLYADKIEFITASRNNIARQNRALISQHCRAGAPDTDADSLCDAVEALFGTDPLNTDSDGDRLSDAAELLGAQGVDLPGLGANPLRADIFVEIDYYPHLRLKRETLRLVEEAFANAARANPDGSSGINLHLLESDAITGEDAKADLNPVNADFYALKSKYFTTQRSGLFHYGLIANRHNGGGSSGLAMGVPGSDFLITLGGWSNPGGTLEQQTGTLMHELGHNLGLHHGGEDFVNLKTNYLSIMNYHYQIEGLLKTDGTRVFDYSRFYINAMSAAFNEIEAMSGYNGTTEEELAEFQVKHQNHLTFGSSWVKGTAAANLDINHNGILETEVTIAPIPAARNDWNYLIYSGNPAKPIGDALLGAQGLTKPGHQVSADEMESCMTEDGH